MRKTAEQLLSEIGAKAKRGLIKIEDLEAFLHDHGGSGYPVTIDYAKTVEQMKKNGQYDWSNDNINSRNFPVNGTGTVNVALELVHLDKVVSSKDVLSYMEANGLRAATVEELLMFGVTYPDIQREFPIVCLGSSWVDPYGNRHVPYLDRGGSYRVLNLHWFDNVWLALFRFLAVRKSV